MKLLKLILLITIILTLCQKVVPIRAESVTHLGILRKCVGAGFVNGCLEYDEDTGKAMLWGKGIDHGVIARLTQFKEVQTKKGKVLLARKGETDHWYRWVDWSRP